MSRDYMAEVKQEREAERLFLSEFHNDGTAMALALLNTRAQLEAAEERAEGRERELHDECVMLHTALLGRNCAEEGAVGACHPMVCDCGTPYEDYTFRDLCEAVTQLRVRAEQAEAAKNGAYRERNQVVAWAAQMSLSLGYIVRVTTTAIDGWDAAWHNCVYIMTPLGQASWHFHDDDAALFADLPRGEVVWDGHTTPEKYERLRMSRYSTRNTADLA